MKNLIVLKNKILVEQISKKPEKQSGLFVEAEVSDSLGEVVAIGEDYEGTLTVGAKVYYGTKREELRMSGKDVLVMDPDNIVARVTTDEKKD
tara:strand:+ start:90612 stop:90887 length:276 start_codon:yes stop_codon:yes gene_type:complete